jgi:hypothetical protein
LKNNRELEKLIGKIAGPEFNLNKIRLRNNHVENEFGRIKLLWK